MTEKESSSPESSSQNAEEIRERADQLQRKVCDLSESLERVERTLGDAAGESQSA